MRINENEEYCADCQMIFMAPHDHPVSVTDTKFTPGPWWANEHSVGATIDGDTVVVAMTMEGLPNTNPYHEMPYKTNARFIAASPYMYEALKVTEYPDGYSCGNRLGCTGNSDRGHDEACIVGNALKKAENVT